MLKPAPESLEKLEAVVGRKYALRGDDMAPFLRESRGRYEGKAAMVLKPGTAAEITKIVSLANEYKLALVPQGGNTGLVAGGVPFESGNEIIVSLSRLNRLRNIDPLANCITVEAGMILNTVQKAAEDVDRLFPLSMGSEGSCEIGGNLATNAGGTNVLRYGNMRELVLGLEVVLADGSLWNGLKTLRKDNTGYDLKQLFIGSEGTLGIITAASLKLFARPRSIETAFIAVPTVEAAVNLLTLAQGESADQVSGFELISHTALGFVLAHLKGASAPLNTSSPWYVLLELSSGMQTEALQNTMEAILSKGADKKFLSNAVIAKSQSQRTAFWRLRESIPEGQKGEGDSIKHDVSLPISSIPDFIARATKAVIAFQVDFRPVVFGHIGDGNIHFNVSQPKGAQTAPFLARWDELNAVIHDIVHEMQGSISAEHGIGRMKRAEFARYKSETEIALMKALKATLDPHNIFNPGVLWV